MAVALARGPAHVFLSHHVASHDDAGAARRRHDMELSAIHQVGLRVYKVLGCAAYDCRAHLVRFERHQDRNIYISLCHLSRHAFEPNRSATMVLFKSLALVSLLAGQVSHFSLSRKPELPVFPNPDVGHHTDPVSSCSSLSLWTPLFRATASWT